MLLYVFPASLIGPNPCIFRGCCCIISGFLGGMAHSKPRAIFGGYENTYLDMRVSLLPSVKNQSLSLQSQELTPPCLELLQFLPWTCGKRSSMIQNLEICKVFYYLAMVSLASSSLSLKSAISDWTLFLPSLILERVRSFLSSTLARSCLCEWVDNLLVLVNKAYM